MAKHVNVGSITGGYDPAPIRAMPSVTSAPPWSPIPSGVSITGTSNPSVLDSTIKAVNSRLVNKIKRGVTQQGATKGASPAPTAEPATAETQKAGCKGKLCQVNVLTTVVGGTSYETFKLGLTPMDDSAMVY